MHDFASWKRRVEEEGIDSIDFRVADLVGRSRHLTIPASRFTECVLSEGIGFDGSNYGYHCVSGSDMVLIPDLSTAYVEERDGERILTLISEICDAKAREPASPTAYSSVLVSPEFEFYVFDEVLMDSDAGRNCVEIAPAEGGHTRPCLGSVGTLAPPTTRRCPRIDCSRCAVRSVDRSAKPGSRSSITITRSARSGSRRSSLASTDSCAWLMPH